MLGLWIKQLETVEEIQNIRSDWERIYNSNVELTPFQAFDWNIKLIEHSIYLGQLRCYLLYRDEEIIVIAPMVILKQGGMSEISLLGENTHSDYLDFIYDQGLEQIEMDYLIKYILKHNRIALLRVSQIIEESKTNAYLKNMDIFIKCTNFICMKIPLKKDICDYEQTLSHKYKKELRLKQGRIVRDFPDVKWEFLFNQIHEEEFQELLKNYINRNNFKGIQLNKNSDYYYFLKEFFGESKDVLLNKCVINGKIAAFNMGLIRNKTLYVMLLSIDSDYHLYSLGLILFYKTIQFLLDKDYGTLDLTRGNDSYKYKIGGVEHTINNYFLSKNKLSFFYSSIPLGIDKIRKLRIQGVSWKDVGRMVLLSTKKIING